MDIQLFGEAGALARPQVLREDQPDGGFVLRSAQALRDEGGGSSRTLTWAVVLDKPPSADAGEITDKGYLKQRCVLARRSSAVLARYMPVTDPRVIRP